MSVYICDNPRYYTKGADLQFYTHDDITFVSSDRYMPWLNEKGAQYQGNLKLGINFHRPSMFTRVDRNPEEHVPGFEVDKNAINFIVLQNVTNPRNWRPITPWIACHRLLHAVEIGDPTPDRRFAKQTLLDTTYEFFTVLAHLGHPEGPRRAPWVPVPNINEALYSAYHSHLNFVAQDVCTFKAARDRKITNPADIMPDLWAQWMLKGTVEFAHGPYYQQVKHQRQKINTAFSQIYNSLCGKVLIW